MAAANKQPTGSRPGPKAAEVHAPIGGSHKAGSGSTGVAGHGTPKGVGANKGNPLH